MKSFDYDQFCKKKLESILPGFQKKWEGEARPPIRHEVDSYVLYE